jgi:hypothetical protein
MVLALVLAAFGVSPFTHGFDAAGWAARERKLTAYRSLVLNALNTSAP